MHGYGLTVITLQLQASLSTFLPALPLVKGQVLMTSLAERFAAGVVHVVVIFCEGYFC